jgi:hypothetical protein
MRNRWTRLTLALAAFTLTLGIADTAPAASGSGSCEQFCWIVSCEGSQVCGPYIKGGKSVCGCHEPTVIFP